MSLKKISIFVFVSMLRCSSAHATFTIMLNPAGDAHHVGRTIQDSFERGLTLQCAEQLKIILESTHRDLRVLITRAPGEVMAPLQQANFANRMHADLYLSIHFYQEKGTRPKMYLYRFSYHDELKISRGTLSFCPYDQVHLFNYDITEAWATILHTCLEYPSYKKIFDLQPVYALPCKPLIGIMAPAIMCEMSLKQSGDWRLYLDPLIASINTLCSVILNTA
jgi:hypothetical protein